jgi:RNA polymerase sigma-B factor
MTPTHTRAPGPAPSRRRLSPAQLEPLFRRWQRHGDDAAREALVRQFLPLARKLARRYAQSSEPYEDLVQVASLALLNAIDRFDPDRGVNFVGFAIPTILGELRRHFRDGTWSVRVTRAAQERAAAVSEATKHLTDVHGRTPTAQQLAEYLELSIEEVVEGLLARMAYDAESLDAPPSNAVEHADTLGDTLGASDEGYALVDDRVTVTRLLPSLSERERRILHMRFAEEMTQSEIAARIGVSQMQVSRLLRCSLERLRELAG